MENSLKIRDARPEDAEKMAEILVAAFPSLYEMTFGKLSQTQMVALLEALYRGGTLPLKDTRLAVVEQDIVGVMILQMEPGIGQGGAETYWRNLRSQLHFWQALRAFLGGLAADFALNSRIPHAPDLVYIEALAVAETARGQGVGSALLADAEAQALQHRRERLALHVLRRNEGAQRLYERVGFVLHLPEPRSKRGGTALLMVRKIA